MKNILVTGPCGFIGSNFVHYLQVMRPDVEIWGLDALTYAGNLDNLKGLPHPEKFHFVRGDIKDIEPMISVIVHNQIDTIVHFAAETHVDRSIQTPLPFVTTNIFGTVMILEMVRQIQKQGYKTPVRFHFVSTDEVYGSLALFDPPSTESSPYDPRSPYAATKAAADHLVMSYWHTYGLPVTISHGSNTYGPRAYPEKFIPLTILRAKSRQPIPIYGNGKNTRDWLFVEDHCSAIAFLLDNGRPGEIYNIGGNESISNINLAQSICRLIRTMYPTGSGALLTDLIEMVPDRPGHDLRYSLDISKIIRLGWHPAFGMAVGLPETVEWYWKNTEWVEKIQADPRYQAWMRANYQGR
jgi:dTDP-glucose 4,6-dehydratase